jgi:anti-sigma B factor antagonist
MERGRKMVSDRDGSIQIGLEDAEGGIVIIRIMGYLDTYNTESFRQRVMEVVESGHVRLIFDCRELSYVSSTGIGSFTTILKSVKTAGGDAVFIHVQPKVSEVFRLLGFSMAFTTKQGLGDAVAHLRGGADASTELFPAVFSCPVCFKKLKAMKPGRFRCSLCASVLEVGSAGEVTLG